MILLDTHVWIRGASDKESISKRAASAIRRHERSGGVGISAISLWEAAFLHRRSRIKTFEPLREWLVSLTHTAGLEVHPISLEVSLAAASLPAAFPADPADRLITATAIVLGCPLVTADERIRSANVVETIW
ncbi:MAG: hypothetical protein QG573_2275 [Acidobacteriota bacterium]|nr:hypothetical protein [Acidobacteriota bacterium]